MKKQIIAFGASSSKNSINQKLAKYASQQIGEAEIDLLDLNNYEMPIYSIDKENENGIPQLAHDFKKLIEKADGLIMSFAEHNGNYSAAFKNIFDWVSRIDMKVWAGKPTLLMATSPGGRGGRSVLDIATAQFSRMSPDLVVTYSLPSFNNNFSSDLGILDSELNELFQNQIRVFKDQVL